MNSRSLYRLALVLTMTLSLAAACGGDDNSKAPSDCTQVVNNQVTLVARNIQWDKSCLKVKAGSTVVFTVKLEDQGTKHDLQVFGQGEKKQTPLESGPATQKLVFDFTSPGYYQFVCTIHANMEGQIYAQ